MIRGAALMAFIKAVGASYLSHAKLDL